ncbi:unnamed protein product [Ectocarpus sp. CCAP 1310/34]|nr:unnamed protein product [Ectocarpus sp. CCAP 1310/34]
MSTTTLAFPDYEAAINGSRPFQLSSDASVHGFGAVLEQHQNDGTMRPLVCVSRSTLPNERNWDTTDLEMGALVWTVKKLRVTSGIWLSDLVNAASVPSAGSSRGRSSRPASSRADARYLLSRHLRSPVIVHRGRAESQLRHLTGPKIVHRDGDEPLPPIVPRRPPLSAQPSLPTRASSRLGDSGRACATGPTSSGPPS